MKLPLERMNKQSRTWIALIVIILLCLVVGVQLLQYEALTKDFAFIVPTLGKVPFFETKWLYVYIHIFAVVPVFCLSFENRIAYRKTWKYLFPATLIVATFFVVWDAIFTILSIWSFNPNYYLGYKLLYLPIEELLFFVTIPFASVFVYENMNYYIQKDLLKKIEPYISIVLLLLFFGVAFFYWQKLNTTVSFLLPGIFLLYHVFFLPAWQRSRFYLAFLVILIPFILVDTVLTGGLTDAPIIVYNPDEYSGFRIISIPIEDLPFGFMLLFWIVSIMEAWRKKEAKQ
jgi:lycopene cyclase domain-containing protein